MFIIGELINGMYTDVGKAIKDKNKSVIQDLAKRQVEAGAKALDINCGPASADPQSAMKWLVESAQEVVDVSLCLDSTKANVIEAGLSVAKQKAIINSSTADKEKLDILIPMAKKYNAKLIGLTLDKKGVPQDKDRRMELACTVITTCQEQGFPIEDLFIDPVVMPVNVAQLQQRSILESIAEFKLLSDPAPKIVVGLSNVSQGTKNRSIINRNFIVMAIFQGLDAAILDPLDKDLVDAAITAELILNKHIFCDSFLTAYRKA